MSTEKTELVRQVYEAMDGRDFSAVPRFFDPAIEIRQSELLPWGGVHRGYEGLREFFRLLMENVESKVSTERLMDAGDAVVQSGRTRGVARRSGKPFDIPEVHIWTIQNGRVTGFRAFIDTPAMLAALGE